MPHQNSSKCLSFASLIAQTLPFKGVLTSKQLKTSQMFSGESLAACHTGAGSEVSQTMALVDAGEELLEGIQALQEGATSAINRIHGSSVVFCCSSWFFFANPKSDRKAECRQCVCQVLRGNIPF